MINFYRISHHSTSDDSSAYRPIEEVKQWDQENPINKFRLYLESQGWWDTQQQEQFLASAKKQVLNFELKSTSDNVKYRMFLQKKYFL